MRKISKRQRGKIKEELVCILNFHLQDERAQILKKVSNFYFFNTFFDISIRTVHLGCERILRHPHIRPALDHFWAIRPDLHLTISTIAWYSPLKNWNLYYVFAHLLAIWPFLSLSDPTCVPDHLLLALTRTWLCNLLSVHSLLFTNSIWFRFFFLLENCIEKE